MRKLLFAAMMALTTTAGAQITFEQSYSGKGAVYVVNLEDEGYKYMLVNTTAQKVDFYNTNHALWKSINVSIPAGYTFSNAYTASTKLFDTDGGVEVVVTYYKSDTSGLTYATQIVNEDGSQLKLFVDCYSIGVSKTDNGWKAIAHIYRNPVYSDVYSLPGQLLGLQKPGKGDNGADMELYPNPMGEAATLRYSLPVGEHRGVIDVYSVSGVKIRSYNVTDQYNNIIIHRNDLPGGTYYYTLTTANGTASAEKFVIL